MNRLAAIAVATTLSLMAASACGSSDSGGSGSGSADSPVTLTWWHNAAQDPGKSVWQGIADDYHKAHPNVTFKVEPAQNEALKTKISVALQSNNPPNIFQQWGGGALATIEGGDHSGSWQPYASPPCRCSASWRCRRPGGARPRARPARPQPADRARTRAARATRPSRCGSVGSTRSP